MKKLNDKILKKYNQEKYIPTGSTEYSKVNNIYDMAGNVEDWTIEADFAGIRVNRRRLL